MGEDFYGGGTSGEDILGIEEEALREGTRSQEDEERKKKEEETRGRRPGGKVGLDRLVKGSH